MVIALNDQWIWDSWYAHDGSRWHAYFLKADKSLGDPELRHLNATHGHAVSEDLVNWTHLGTCFQPAPAPAWDDRTTWTGSVVQDDAGVWHLFYTSARASENALYQRIGHATSTDMHNWLRVGDGFCLDLIGPNAKYYEVEHMAGQWVDRAMRDPWVMRNPAGDGWLMYFTARVTGQAEINEGGAIGFATSPDLVNWTLQPPVYSGSFAQFEVPQVFEVNGKWYCLFCTTENDWSVARRAEAGMPPVRGNHYLIADNPRGPWHVAPGFLDGDPICRRYAARILDTGEGLVILGFDDNGRDNFVGHVRDPEPVFIDPEGFLYIQKLEPKAAE